MNIKDLEGVARQIGKRTLVTALATQSKKLRKRDNFGELCDLADRIVDKTNRPDGGK